MKISIQRYKKDIPACLQPIKYSLKQVNGANSPEFITLDESQNNVIRVIINSNARSDAFQKVVILWLNGTVDNPDGTKAVTGIKIPVIIYFLIIKAKKPNLMSDFKS